MNRKARAFGEFWRGWLVALCAGLLIVSLPQPQLSAQPITKKVRLTVDYGDGVEKRFTGIAWREGLTVLDAMNAAAGHKRGIKFKHRGRGETTFLTSIDDQENEGGGDGRNWQFWVNGRYGLRGIGVMVLQPRDEIVWKFKKYSPQDTRRHE